MELEKTPELAYILSNLVVGDGGVYKLKQRDKRLRKEYYYSYMVQMESIDKEYVDSFNEKICKILNKKHIAKLQLKKRQGYHDIWRIRVCCKRNFYDLVKSLPEDFLENLWHTFHREFLQSWFDSDGSIVVRNGGMMLSLTNSKKKWLVFSQTLLKEKYGIEMNLYQNQHLKSGKIQWTLSTGKRSTIKQFYEGIGFGICRKQKRLENGVENYA